MSSEIICISVRKGEKEARIWCSTPPVANSMKFSSVTWPLSPERLIVIANENNFHLNKRPVSYAPRLHKPPRRD